MQDVKGVNLLINILISLLSIVVLLRIFDSIVYYTSGDIPLFVIALVSVIVPSILIYYVRKRNKTALTIIAPLVLLGLSRLQLDFSTSLLATMSLITLVLNLSLIVIPIIILARISESSFIKEFLKMERNDSEIKSAVKVLFLIGLISSIALFLTFSIKLMMNSPSNLRTVLFSLAGYAVIVALTIYALKKKSHFTIVFLSIFPFLISVYFMASEGVFEDLIQKLINILYVLFGIFPLIIAFTLGLFAPITAIITKFNKQKK